MEDRRHGTLCSDWSDGLGAQQRGWMLKPSAE